MPPSMGIVPAHWGAERGSPYATGESRSEWGSSPAFNSSGRGQGQQGTAEPAPAWAGGLGWGAVAPPTPPAGRAALSAGGVLKSL